VVGVLVPQALAIEEPVEVLLVEGRPELGPVSDGDGVLRAPLVVLALGGLSTVAVLVRQRWTSITGRPLLIIPLTRAIGRVAAVLVPMMSMLGILHVSVLVDDGHHVGECPGVALKHLSPQFDVVEALVEVVNHVPVFNLYNGVMVSEVPHDVVMEGLRRLLCDAAQIPSGFGTQAGSLEVLDEGGVEVLPAIDGAIKECF
jgi:hypothetical protein